MSYEYKYEFDRGIIQEGQFTGSYDIEHPNRVNPDGSQIYLSKELESIIPCKYTISCNDLMCTIYSENELNQEILDNIPQVISNHRNNVEDLSRIVEYMEYKIQECSTLMRQWINNKYSEQWQIDVMDIRYLAEKNGLTNRVAYIDQLSNWVTDVRNYYLMYVIQQIQSLTSIQEIKNYTLDLSDFDIGGSHPDPQITYIGIFSIIN